MGDGTVGEELEVGEEHCGHAVEGCAGVFLDAEEG